MKRITQHAVNPILFMKFNFLLKFIATNFFAIVQVEQISWKCTNLQMTLVNSSREHSSGARRKILTLALFPRSHGNKLTNATSWKSWKKASDRAGRRSKW